MASSRDKADPPNKPEQRLPGLGRSSNDMFGSRLGNNAQRNKDLRLCHLTPRGSVHSTAANTGDMTSCLREDMMASQARGNWHVGHAPASYKRLQNNSDEGGDEVGRGIEGGASSNGGVDRWRGAGAAVSIQFLML